MSFYQDSFMIMFFNNVLNALSKFQNQLVCYKLLPSYNYSYHRFHISYRALLEVPNHIVTYQTAQIVVLMTYDRYWALCRPFTYKTRFTSRYRSNCFVLLVIELVLITVAYISDIFLSTYYLSREDFEINVSILEKLSIFLCFFFSLLSFLEFQVIFQEILHK